MVSVEVLPGQDLTSTPLIDAPVVVSVQPPAGESRAPCDICCVMDISWSMSMEAVVTNAEGKSESNGLSLLDIAKHAMNTVISNLGDSDRLSIVQFCRQADTKLPLTAMSGQGKERAAHCCERMGFGNGTHLWRGIKNGLDSLRPGCSAGRFSHLLILTDGETEERDDVMRELVNYQRQHNWLPSTINCFGFGYEIDSQLLVEIAEFAQGTYAFIPDAGFVGTVFVNAMSNLFVTMAQDVTLTLAANSGAEIQEIGGGLAYSKGDNDVYTVKLGTLQYGQTKDLSLRMKIASAEEPYLNVVLEYTPCAGSGPEGLDRQLVNAEALPGDFCDDFKTKVDYHDFRSSFVSTLQRVIRVASPDDEKSIQDAREIITSLGARIGESDCVEYPPLAALLEDVMGQCSEAVSRTDWFTRWGRHYIPSVMFAHMLQQCNNFKDPGVQVYGGELFESCRDAADDAFNTLAAPKITPAEYRYVGNKTIIRNPDYDAPGFRPKRAASPGRRAASPRPAASPPPVRAAPAVSMAAYNDRYGGCIDEACQAIKESGTRIALRDLSKGDKVLASDGSVVEVECIVRTACVNEQAELVEMPGGARLTPYHPVKLGDDWRFPLDLAASKVRTCKAVCSLVLKGRAPEILVDGVPCIALGHGIQEGVARHDYFGSRAVIDDLKRFAGYRKGRVELSPECVMRDPVTGAVCGLREFQHAF